MEVWIVVLDETGCASRFHRKSPKDISIVRLELTWKNVICCNWTVCSSSWDEKTDDNIHEWTIRNLVSGIFRDDDGEI